MKDFLLETFPNPERKGCPDDKTLQALAEDKLPADHPARLHVGSCSECYSEYRNYRLDWGEAKAAEAGERAATTGPVEVPPFGADRVRTPLRLRAVPLAVAASLIVMCSGGYLAFKHYHSVNTSGVQLASSQPVNATVDLFNSGTLRGTGDDATPLQEVSLPASIVHLSVVLPRFSESGSYTVNVSRDKSGSQIVATGAGNGVQQEEGKVVVNVTLDLRAARTGAYFLATVRATDNGTYYYPLKIN